MRQAEETVDLGTSVGYVLKQSSSALHTAMEEALRPIGLTITQYSCLELLQHRPGMSSADLARGAFVTRQSMHVVLQVLEREGLVTRAQTAAVGRALPTRLTDLGGARLARASAAVRAVERAAQTDLRPAEVEQLQHLLVRYRDGLARIGRPDPTEDASGTGRAPS